MKYGWIILILLSACASTRKPSFGCEGCKATVVVFIGVDCPVSQKYVARLNNLFGVYRDSIIWKGYVPQPVSQKQVEEFVREYDVQFPILPDARLKAVHALNATITPQVFVLGPKGEILYAGAIDNWFYELGRYRQETSEFYLRDALASVEKQSPVRITSTQAIGCTIQRK